MALGGAEALGNPSPTQAADGPREIAKGVGARVPVLRRVGGLTHADAVEHDDRRPPAHDASPTYERGSRPRRPVSSS